MLLLDTCTLLWLVADPDRLGAKATGALQANAGSLFVSAISAFEIAVKHAKKKLRLPMKPQDWFPQALEFHGLEEVPVTSAIALRSAGLPPHHMDPCDRIIVATCEVNGMSCVTPDPLIRAYGQARVIW